MRHKQTGTQYIRALFLGVSDEVRYKPGPDLITVQPRYNAPHYSAVFSITQSCHGSQNDYFAICLL